MLLSPNHLLGMNHNHKHSNMNNNYSDPVCGKIMDDSQKAYTYQYQDKTYYFDSEDCINKFKQAPESYVNTTSKHNHLGYWSLGAISMGVMMLFMLN
jgi:Cu+-exporting ATPase